MLFNVDLFFDRWAINLLFLLSLLIFGLIVCIFVLSFIVYVLIFFITILILFCFARSFCKYLVLNSDIWVDDLLVWFVRRTCARWYTKTTHFANMRIGMLHIQYQIRLLTRNIKVHEMRSNCSSLLSILYRLRHSWRLDFWIISI